MRHRARAIPLRTGGFGAIHAVSAARQIGPLNMTPTPEEMSPEDVLRIKLEVLRREHRDLDAAIAALHESARNDPLTLQRLKKQKLKLKDRIIKIEDDLTPDIIA